MLPYAIAAITGALVFYTLGVWGEKLSRSLKLWHVVLFWLGLVCDTGGTALMGNLAGSAFTVNFHSITGMAAILLMAVHAVWASVTLLQNRAAARRSFHKFSLLVWVIWLIPYLSGMIFGVAR